MTYIDKQEARIKKYRAIIKHKPNENVLKKIKALTNRVKICRKFFKNKKVTAARKKVFKKVVVQKRVFKGCVKVNRSISKNQLSRWNKRINKFKNLKAKSNPI
jgi:hypothetical protein